MKFHDPKWLVSQDLLNDVVVARRRLMPPT